MIWTAFLCGLKDGHNKKLKYNSSFLKYILGSTSNTLWVYKGDFAFELSLKVYLPPTTSLQVLPASQQSTTYLSSPRKPRHHWENCVSFDTYIINSYSGWKQIPLKKPTLMKWRRKECQLSKQKRLLVQYWCHTFHARLNFLLESQSEKVIMWTRVII